MSLIHANQDPVPAELWVDDRAEALIREARRRTRRRRLRRLATVVLLGGVAAAACGLSGGRPAGVITETASRPYVNLRAFSDHGELAFISRGRAWVLDGDRGTLRALPVPAGYTATSPGFSHDGRWLAYTAARARDPYGPYELWIAHADGTDARPVRRLVVNEFVGWSPSLDLLAVEAGVSRSVPFGSPLALDLVSASGRVRTVLSRSSARVMARRGAIWSVVWSPSGTSLAVSTYSPERDSGTRILEVPTASGARATLWLWIRSSQRLHGLLSCGRGCGDDEAIAQLAGWWPKWGIAFWVFSSGMTHNSDSTPLAAISRPGAQPRLIADTLSDEVTDAVSAGPGGELAVVQSSGSAGREYADGKTGERCSPNTPTCAELPGASTWTGASLPCRPCFNAPLKGPGSGVSLDPAWSPDGSALAYVKAPAYRSAAWPTLAWFDAHELYIWDARTNATRRIGTINGSSLPTWSRDGQNLLYVSADGLWLTDAHSGKAVEIAHPLYPESAWKQIGTIASIGFYGQVPWSKQFSWYSA